MGMKRANRKLLYLTRYTPIIFLHRYETSSVTNLTNCYSYKIFNIYKGISEYLRFYYLKTVRILLLYIAHLRRYKHQIPHYVKSY